MKIYTRLSEFSVPSPISWIRPRHAGQKLFTWILVIAAATVTYFLTTGVIWKLGQSAGTNVELVAQQVGPLVGLVSAFVASAFAFRWGGWSLRSLYDNPIRGKLWLLGQSFEDPDAVYEHVKDVRDFLLKELGFPKWTSARLDRAAEATDGSGDLQKAALSAVLKQADRWCRPPRGMKNIVTQIQRLDVSDTLKVAILDRYSPGTLGDSISGAISDDRFAKLYRTEIDARPRVRALLDGIILKDLDLVDVGWLGHALGRYGIKLPIRRTLGLDPSERVADENANGSPRWYLFRRPRPYTSVVLNPLWWERNELDLGNRLEQFVSATAVLFAYKSSYPNADELTRTQAKAFILGRIRSLKLESETHKLSMGGHELRIRGLPEQLADRKNYLFLGVDNCFRRVFAESHAYVTGALLAGAPVALGIALFFLGFDKYWLWNLGKPVVRPIMDFVWP